MYLRAAHPGRHLERLKDDGALARGLPAADQFSVAQATGARSLALVEPGDRRGMGGLSGCIECRFGGLGDNVFTGAPSALTLNQRVHSSILCTPTTICAKTRVYERDRILGSSFYSCVRNVSMELAPQLVLLPTSLTLRGSQSRPGAFWRTEANIRYARHLPTLSSTSPKVTFAAGPLIAEQPY